MVNTTLLNHPFILKKYKDTDRYGKMTYEDEIIVYGKENLTVNTKYLLNIATYYLTYTDIKANDLINGYAVIDAKPHFNTQNDFIFMEVKARVRDKIIE